MFKKVQHVSLVNESEQDEDGFGGDSDMTTLISEDEEAEENVRGKDLEEGRGGLNSLGGATGMQKRWRWKFWKRERLYELSHTPSDVQQPVENMGREVTLCGRKVHLCTINSWRAIFLVVFVFSISITLAVIISKLAAEPNLRQGECWRLHGFPPHIMLSKCVTFDPQKVWTRR